MGWASAGIGKAIGVTPGTKTRGYIPKGHLTAIRRMAKELNDWIAHRPVHCRWFWADDSRGGWLFNKAREHKGQLQITADNDPWQTVNMSTARFRDRREGRDLAAIK